MVVLRYLHLRSTLLTWLCTSELRLTVVRDYPDGWLLMLLGSRGMPYWYPITLGASSQRMPFKVELPIDFVTANMDSHYIFMAEFNCVGSICILAHEKLQGFFVGRKLRLNVELNSGSKRKENWKWSLANLIRHPGHMGAITFYFVTRGTGRSAALID